MVMEEGYNRNSASGVLSVNASAERSNPLLFSATRKGTYKGAFRWRRKRDSNPRGREPKRFSRPPRCDRFDIPPSVVRRIFYEINYSSERSEEDTSPTGEIFRLRIFGRILRTTAKYSSECEKFISHW